MKSPTTPNVKLFTKVFLYPNSNNLAMRKSLYTLSLGLGLLCTAITFQSAQAVSINLLPTNQTVSVGNSLGIDIQISELGDLQSPSLSGFALNLSFDPTILSFNNLSFGDPVKGDLVGLSDATRFTDIQTNLGVISFAEISLDDPTALNQAQPDSFIIARANFTALNAGSSLLTLSVDTDGLSDENTNPLFLTTVPRTADVTVTELVRVPEPNFSLLGLGLTMGLGIALTKKKLKYSPSLVEIMPKK
jgi:hypothetical protein